MGQLQLLVLDLEEFKLRSHLARCRACRHRLRTPASQALGIGPECAARLGIAPRRSIRITGVPRGWAVAGQADLLEESCVNGGVA